MIDKNGKLFGKINIIDLLIILVIVAAAAFFAVRYLGGGGEDSVGSTKTTVEISFYCNSAPTGISDSMEIGATAYEDNTDKPFGKVVSFSTEPAYTYESDEDGKAAKVPEVGYDFLYVTVEVEGELTEAGIKLGGKLFSVGGGYTVHFGKVMQYGKITSITPVA